MFPWSGQLIMRGGYARGNHWAWLDLGPYGSSGHGHRDKLHLSIRAYGVHLLVDSGRFAYEGPVADQFRDYAVGTAAHNTIMLDGREQSSSPGENDENIVPGGAYPV